MQGRLSKPVTDKIQAFPFNNWEMNLKLLQKLAMDVLNGLLIQRE